LLGVAKLLDSLGRSLTATRAQVTYIMIKPDGVQRGLIAEIISRFEKRGYQLKGALPTGAADYGRRQRRAERGRPVGYSSQP
jgi:hypothetical protein